MGVNDQLFGLRRLGGALARVVSPACFLFNEGRARARPAKAAPGRRTPGRGLNAFLSVVVILLAFTCAQAIQLKEYRDNLKRAVSALDSLALSDETENAESYAARSSETLDGVRTLVPVRQTVEWKSETFEVDNAWLHVEIDKYRNAKVEERPELLRKTTERLQAVEQRVADLESPSATYTTNKEEENRKLKEILQRSEYARKEKGESAIGKLLERFVKWFQSLFPEPKPMSPGKAGIATKIAQVLVVLLALVVLGFVLKLFLPRMWRQRKPKKKVKAEPRIVLGEMLAPDQSARDLLAEAEALARRGELRAAIRKAYIALLVELGDRKILHLAEHKTNRDYLSAVYQNRSLYGNVKQLTDSFERHWYGLSQASETDWQSFRAGCERTLS